MTGEDIDMFNERKNKQENKEGHEQLLNENLEKQENYNDVSIKLSGLTRDFNKEKMNLEIEPIDCKYSIGFNAVISKEAPNE